MESVLRFHDWGVVGGTNIHCRWRRRVVFNAKQFAAADRDVERLDLGNVS